MLDQKKQYCENILKMKYSDTFPKFHRKAALLCSLFNDMVAEREILLRKDSGAGSFENISKKSEHVFTEHFQGNVSVFYQIIANAVVDNDNLQMQMQIH